jgi:hypothetical protein
MSGGARHSGSHCRWLQPSGRKLWGTQKEARGLLRVVSIDPVAAIWQREAIRDGSVPYAPGVPVSWPEAGGALRQRGMCIRLVFSSHGLLVTSGLGVHAGSHPLGRGAVLGVPSVAE